MLLEIIIIAIALSMDAFTIAICKGLTIHSNLKKSAIIIGLYFGIFQAIMPFIGFSLGIKFKNIVESFDHWIIFLVLISIGINMLLDKKDEDIDSNISYKEMIPLAVATSIDALAVGITLAFLNSNILLSCSIIGIITFTLSVIAVHIGNKFNNKFKNKSSYIGGIILIIIGIKILFEHLKII